MRAPPFVQGSYHDVPSVQIRKTSGFKPDTAFEHITDSIPRALAEVSTCDDQAFDPGFNFFDSGYLFSENIRSLNIFLDHIERILNIKIETPGAPRLLNRLIPNAARADIVLQNPTLGSLSNFIASKLGITLKDIPTLAELTA